MKRKTKNALYQGRYAVYNNNDLTRLKLHKEILEISIDPASTNYGIAITKRSLGNNPDYALNIRLLEADRKCFNYKHSEQNCELYEQITDYLNSFHKYFTTTAVVVIVERQVDLNQLNEKITQHTLSYYCLLARMMPNVEMFVLDLNANERLKYLNVKRGEDAKQKSVDGSRKLLDDRNDEYGKKILKCYQARLHDIADCINQGEAFFEIIGIGITRPELFSIDNV